MGTTVELISACDESQDEYTVKRTRHGIVISSPVPIGDLSCLVKHFDEEGYKIASPRLAGRLRAAFVICKDAEAEEAWAKSVFHQGPYLSIADYLNGDDYGISSMTILRATHKLADENGRFYWPSVSVGVPSDASDFGRCYRLVNKHLPQIKPHLHAVAEMFPQWTPLIQAWPELEALYAEEEKTATEDCWYPKLNARIDELNASWKGERKQRV